MGNTTEKIRTAALRIFQEDGLDNLSMRKIGKAVGISATALYRHYASKEHLIADLVNRGFELFYQYEMKALSGRTAWERLSHNGAMYLQFALDYPDFYRLIFLEDWCKENPEMAEQLSQKASGTLQFLVDRLRECMDEGHLRREDPHHMALAVWSMCHGVVALYLQGAFRNSQKGENDVHTIFRRSIQMMFQGLMTGPPPQPEVPPPDLSNLPRPGA